jgi:integrase
VKAKLTNISIARLKPKAHRFEVADAGCRNLVLIIQPTGVKTYAMRLRLNQLPIKVTIGRTDDISLTDAHERAAEIRSLVRRGIDPRRHKDEAERAASHRFAAVAEQYFVAKCGMQVQAKGEPRFNREVKRSAREQWRILQRQAMPAFGDRQIESIMRGDIRDMLDRVASSAGPIAANRLGSIVRVIMLWFERQDDFGSYRAPSFKDLARPETPREHILDQRELKVIWQAAGDIAAPFGPFIHFLLLTGCRRGEASGMRRGEVREETFDHGKAIIWTCPSARSKTKKPIVRPLSRMAVEVLDTLPRVEDSELYFTRGERVIASFGRDKKRLDQRVLEILRQDDPAAKPLASWRLHDLRRTSRSLMSKAGVQPHVAERCLGHVVGGAIERTYDRYDHVREMADAFERLANLIQAIVSPSNVIPLKRTSD